MSAALLNIQTKNKKTRLPTTLQTSLCIVLFKDTKIINYKQLHDTGFWFSFDPTEHTHVHTHAHTHTYIFIQSTLEKFGLRI